MVVIVALTPCVLLGRAVESTWWPAPHDPRPDRESESERIALSSTCKRGDIHVQSGVPCYIHVLMKEERKKQARSNKQTRQSNTAHPTCMFVCLGYEWLGGLPFLFKASVQCACISMPYTVRM